MSVKYRLVLRKDMTKGAAADAKLFYAASSSNGMCDLASLCEIIADRSAATAGDVKLVLDGLLFVVKQKLQDGQTIQLGDLGYFQAVLGSKVAYEKGVYHRFGEAAACRLPSGQDPVGAGQEVEGGAYGAR